MPIEREIAGGEAGLDSTSASASTSSAAATGQAGNDDVKEGDDSCDDGLKHGTDAIDDGHETRSDGLKDRLDLEGRSAWCYWGPWNGGKSFSLKIPPQQLL